MTKPVYLDFNATTPLDSEVLEAMKPFIEHEFGNPSSTHWFGIAPKRAIDKARTQVAEILNCEPAEIIFNGGGTESNNHAIIGTAQSLKHKGNHIITTQIEHPAVLNVCSHLEFNGFSVTHVAVDEHGMVSTFKIKEATRPETILITVMHANNEVGTIEPIEEIAQMARERGIIFHTDAAQSVGKIATDVKSLGVDLLSIAGHKLYAPKGIGALYIRKGTSPDIYMHGAGQEMGKRAGTENVSGIVGLGKACEVARRDLKINSDLMKKNRDALLKGLQKAWPDLRRNGHPEKVLPNTLSVSFKGFEANRILEEIGLEIAASAGAACHSDLVEISHVLLAMGLPKNWAKGTIRFSTGKITRGDDIETAVRVTLEALKKLAREKESITY
ncbi:MAG: cysteine desulfurase [Desulfobacterales bacterium]|nr:cysteine desulfurase [Desulfobacterales bacterium]